jgi:predicted nucleic acid-binding protein
MKPVLLDTGVIVALLDVSERYHQVCAALIKSVQPPLVTCEAVITESCYLLRKLRGAPAAIMENVAAGIFQISYQLSGDAEGIRQKLRKYQEREIDLADACLIRMAELFETGDILTLDRDFEVYRWAKNKAFRILPSLR